MIAIVYPDGIGVLLAVVEIVAVVSVDIVVVDIVVVVVAVAGVVEHFVG